MSGRPADGIEAVNREYYNRLYRKRNPLLSLLHPLVSFDQQSKSGRNFAAIRPWLRATSSAGDPPSVLDYGFGHGSFLLKVPRRCRAAGCDISSEAVRSVGAVGRLLGRELDLFTVESFGERTAGRKFDAIICSHVLEHVPDDAAVLSQIAALLSPRGRILINLPINEVWDDPKHVRRYDARSIAALLERCGLQAERTWECDRWTSFFLRHEWVRPAPAPLKPVLRALRLLLALLPYRVVDALEVLLPRADRPQQILTLALRRP